MYQYSTVAVRVYRHNPYALDLIVRAPPAHADTVACAPPPYPGDSDDAYLCPEDGDTWDCTADQGQRTASYDGRLPSPGGLSADECASVTSIPAAAAPAPTAAATPSAACAACAAASPTVTDDAFANHYKTRMCKNYARLGQCRYDVLCRFAHGKADLRTYGQNVYDGITSVEALRDIIAAEVRLHGRKKQPKRQHK